MIVVFGGPEAVVDRHLHPDTLQFRLRAVMFMGHGVGWKIGAGNVLFSREMAARTAIRKEAHDHFLQYVTPIFIGGKI